MFLRRVAILDTSWLLKLYQVLGCFDKSGTNHVRNETTDVVTAGCERFVTVPVLFEVASHITHVRDGRRRNTLGKGSPDYGQSSGA